MIYDKNINLIIILIFRVDIFHIQNPKRNLVKSNTFGFYIPNIY